MTRLNTTYGAIAQRKVATTPLANDRKPATRPTISDAPSPATNDRVSLSADGLSAAAQFSNLVPRSATVDTPALPAPASMTETVPAGAPNLADETPLSRNLVRRTYAQSRDTALPGTQVDILA